jgi:hypothetical protein
VGGLIVVAVVVAAVVLLNRPGSASPTTAGASSSPTPRATIGQPTIRTITASPATQAPTLAPPATPLTYKTLTERSWRQVVKAPDDYIGHAFQIWACISQFDAATGPDAFRGEASYQNEEYWYLDSQNSFFYGDAGLLADFVADDVVLMNVLTLGSYTYDTTLGGSTTVPLFEVDQITNKGSC